MNVIKVELVNSQEPTFLTAIIVAVIIIIGITLLIIGNSSKKPSFSFIKEILSLFKNKKLLQVFGLTFLIVGASILVLESSQVRNNLVALAVVFATVFSAISLNETQKLRKENANLRNKETLEKGLDQINDWLNDVFEHISKPSRFISNSTELKKIIMDCRADLTNDVATSINTLAICDEIASNPLVPDENKKELKTAAINVDKAIRDYTSMLYAANLDTITTESIEQIADSAADLTTKIAEMLMATARISLNSPA